MLSKRLSIVLMLFVALLASGGAMARNGGGFRGGYSGGGFGGGHAGGGFRGGQVGGGFRGGHIGDGFRGGHFGGPHFRGFDHHVHGGFFIGGPLFWPSYSYRPYYSYPPYYSSPAIVIPSVPSIYIEQSTVPKAQALESDNWDYCSNPEGYYPHVKVCPAGWQKIASHPLGLESGYWYYCTDPAGYYPYIRECSVMWQKVVR